MKVVAAYLLALLGGNSSPSAKDIEAILGAGAMKTLINCLVSPTSRVAFRVTGFCVHTYLLYGT